MSGSGEWPSGSLAAALSTIPDPRRRQRRAHGLVAILQVAVVAMLCGAKSLYAIGQWARERREDAPQLLEALGVRHGKCPSVPTLHRVFKKMPVADFEEKIGGWLRSTGLQPQETIGIDGKTLRGIHGEEVPGVHLVSAYALHAKAVIDQVACAGKGHELDGVRQLIDRLPLQGNLIVGDALLCQRDICAKIVKGEGDYLFPAKKNQPTLRQDIRRAFSPTEA